MEGNLLIDELLIDELPLTEPAPIFSIRYLLKVS